MFNQIRISAAVVAGLVITVAPAQELQLKLLSSGLSAPMQVVQDPSRANVQYIVERAGVIKVRKDGVVLPTPFLDISSKVSTSGERGLLGMTFRPGTSGNEFVLHYVRSSSDLSTQISKFTRSGNPDLAETTESSVMSIAQPAGLNNHKGGSIHFGADGMLYILTGDGGGSNDPANRAQNPASLLGKALRIDVSGDDFLGDPEQNYAIPTDNPFFGADPAGVRDEVWGIGYRNPFRWSFDDFGAGATGGMLVADVGQGAREEVNFEAAGSGGHNYGWREYEGSLATGLSGHGFTNFTFPIHEYSRPVTGSSITGGRVYRGDAMGSAFKGRYFFGDYIMRKVWSFKLDVNGGIATATDLIEHTEIGGVDGVNRIVSFDIDAAGELILTDIAGGRIYQLEVVPEPGTLAALGLGLAALARRRRK